MPDVIERITAYLSGGGLFNPECADHDTVRDLLIDCRAELQESRIRNAMIYGTSHPEIYKTPDDERIELLEAELHSERKWREDFCMDYRIKCDEELKAALAALKVAREALAETRRVEVEHCEAMGFTESELPDFAFEHIDNALARIDAVLGGGGE